MLELASLRLQDYTGVIRRRYWIVLVLALVAALTAYFYSSRQQPVYQAGASVLVTPNVIDYWTMGAVERLLNTYVGHLRTGEVAKRVVDRMELDVSPDTVLGGLRTAIVRDSYIVVIQVKSTSPRQAVHAANGFAYELVQLAQSEQSSGPSGDIFVQTRVFDEASNAVQIGPRLRFNVAVALVLGGIAGIVLALVSEFLDARVRLRREAEQILGVPIVACIPPVPK